MRATLTFRRDIKMPEDHRHKGIVITLEGDPEGVTELITQVRDKLKVKWVEE